MVDLVNRNIILRRRMAFLSGALAVVSGCDKTPPPKPPPTDVTIGDIADTGGLPTASPSTEPLPPEPKAPPHPSTQIPKTDCAGDRDELLRLKKIYDEAYAETDAIYASLPSSCAVTDDACSPKYELSAKRFHRLQERTFNVLGMCSCPAPIVAEYASTHAEGVHQRMQLIRDRIVKGGADPDAAGKKWDELLRNEATPRPCLSCVYCEPKSACD
jgi:hypothetical protein